MLNVANRMIIFERQINVIVFTHLIKRNKRTKLRLFTSCSAFRKLINKNNFYEKLSHINHSGGV